MQTQALPKPDFDAIHKSKLEPKLEHLRKRINQLINQTISENARTFKVSLGGNFTEEMMNAVIPEYQKAGWTVRRIQPMGGGKGGIYCGLPFWKFS